MLGAVEGPTVSLTGPSVPAALPLLVPGTAPQHELLTWIPIAGDKNFMRAFEVAVLPRMILLDKEGRIAELKLPKPSDPKFEKILKKLKL